MDKCMYSQEQQFLYAMSKALAYDILLYLQILVNKICTIMKICHYSTDMRSRKDNSVRLFFIKKSLNGNRVEQV